MFGSSALKTLVPRTWRQQFRDIQAGLALAHVSGPHSIDVAANQAVVTCLVKNGQFYVDQFIEHYRGLGFTHVCFLDNGSTDKTIELARRHKNVTIYHCTMGVGGHQNLLKRKLAERSVSGGWCLDVDIDEFFDYPHSDVVPLPRFLEYLNRKNFSAMVTHMLDMFSDQPLSFLAENQDEDLKQTHRFYDISQVTKTGYLDAPLTTAHAPRNRTAHADAALQWGGIRQTIFGFKCLLTKHSLFRTGAGLQLFPHVHFVDGANLADVSGVLLHYKFASNAREEAAQNRAAFPVLSQGYERILEAIANQPHRRIKTDTAMAFRGASDLLENRFLFASEDYRSYVRAADQAWAVK